jgi:hypothetical protein
MASAQLVCCLLLRLRGGMSHQPLAIMLLLHPPHACMHAGAAKILWHMPIIWFILAKYAAASALTMVADSAITAVAWDSAGVTTGGPFSSCGAASQHS